MTHSLWNTEIRTFILVSNQNTLFGHYFARGRSRILVMGAVEFWPQGRGALSPKFAQNRVFTLKLPENCMILKKFLGARRDPPVDFENWGQGSRFLDLAPKLGNQKSHFGPFSPKHPFPTSQWILWGSGFPVSHPCTMVPLFACPWSRTDLSLLKIGDFCSKLLENCMILGTRGPRPKGPVWIRYWKSDLKSNRQNTLPLLLASFWRGDPWSDWNGMGIKPKCWVLWF